MTKQAKSKPPLPPAQDPAQAPDPSPAQDDLIWHDLFIDDFIKQNAGLIAYVIESAEWYAHNMVDRWVPDGECHETVYQKIRLRCRTYAKTQPRALHRAVCSAATYNAIEGALRRSGELSRRASQFDADPWLLNMPHDGDTGSVAYNLRTGIPQRSEIGNYFTKSTRVAAGGPHKLWDEFLARITGGDTDLVAYLQRVCGYVLTGDTSEHALFFLYGVGANGKSVFVNTIANAMGSYATRTTPGVFLDSKNERHPTELARLRGSRLVCAPEIDSDKTWNESLIKTLTGGDTVVARFMFKDFFEFKPTFKIFISGNDKPGIRNFGESIRRRLHLIPFSVVIPEAERDLGLELRLRAEFGGILSWAMEGCAEWQRIGLAPPKAVKDATDEYLEDEDVLSRWVKSCCYIAENCTCRTSDLWASWREWAEARGFHQRTDKFLSKNLQRMGFKMTRVGIERERGYAGLRIMTETERAGNGEFWKSGDASGGL